MPRARILLDELYDDETGCEFDFFQAMRLLEAAAADRLPPTLDPVDRLAAVTRIRTHVGMSFPASSIAGVRRPGAERGRGDPGLADAASITPVFFGLTGPNGTLPLHYTEVLSHLVSPAERAALRDWFDIFNHRLGLLLYAGWEKYRLPVRFARYASQVPPPGGRAVPDLFTLGLFSLVGMGTPAAWGRIRVESPAPPDADRPPPLAKVNDLALLHYAGLLSRGSPCAAGLEILVGDYFGVGARVEEMTGQWLNLNEAAKTKLTDASVAKLGQTTIAGERVWDVSSRFRIVLGPLTYAAFVEFLPDPSPVAARKAFFLLSQLVRLYAGPEFDFEIQLGLIGSEVPDCEIQEVADGDLGVRLGWNTWLPRTEAVDLVDDVCLDGDPRTRLA